MSLCLYYLFALMSWEPCSVPPWIPAGLSLCKIFVWSPECLLTPDYVFSKGRWVWVFWLFCYHRTRVGKCWLAPCSQCPSLFSSYRQLRGPLFEDTGWECGLPHWLLSGPGATEPWGAGSLPCLVRPVMQVVSTPVPCRVPESSRDPEQASRWDGSLFLSTIDLSCSETVIILV